MPRQNRNAPPPTGLLNDSDGPHYREASRSVQESVATAIDICQDLPATLRQVLAVSTKRWRRLAEELRRCVAKDGLRSLALVGDSAGVGVTTISAALTIALAENTSLRLLLVDANRDRSDLTALFGLSSKSEKDPALPVTSSGLSGESSAIGFCLFRVDNPSPAAALSRLIPQYDLTILDMGAVRPEHAAQLAGIDAAIFVRSAPWSRKSDPEALTRSVRAVGVRPLGIIENAA